MKKSEALRLAISAVINSAALSGEVKVKVLRILFAEENLAIYLEKEELKKQEKENG